MFRKILLVLVGCGCLLAWSSNGFAYTGYFETVNLDEGGFKDVFAADILAVLRLEQELGDSYPTDPWAYQSPPGTIYTLYDDGTRGDIEDTDGKFTYTFPSTGVTIGEEFGFWIGMVEEDTDTFDGNTLTPATVTATINQLVWDSVTGADSYLVGIWNTDHDFYPELDGENEVDFSDSLKSFSLDSSTTSITDLGLPGIPEGTDYTYGIFAIGDAGYDGGSAVKGTLTVTPEPASFLLFVLGGIALIFCGKKNRRKVRVLA
jgi:hypothetical protein